MDANNFVLNILGFFLLYVVSSASSGDSDCGKKNQSQLPWTVGIYLEKEQYLELICLGTVLKKNYIITAAQCVCESLSKDIRKEHIFVHTDIKQQLGMNSNAIRLKTKDIISRSDYEGFLLNPAADLAVLKLDGSLNMVYPVCVDWGDDKISLQERKSGVLPLWDRQINIHDTFHEDHDICRLSTSENFGNILVHDKECFKVPTSDVLPETIGAGIYVRNPKEDRWYLEGVVSAKEKYKNEAYVAVTSARHYLPWLSRVCVEK